MSKFREILWEFEEFKGLDTVMEKFSVSSVYQVNNFFQFIGIKNYLTKRLFGE